jgi:RNA polymerase sigma-70 factor (ECF subfamily)
MPTCSTLDDAAPALAMSEPEHFEELVREHGPAVLRLALGALRDHDAAETITQDCLWKAWRARGSFRGECSERNWLMGIAVNLIRDHLRSRRLMFWKRDAVVPIKEIAGTLFADRRSPETIAIAREMFAKVWSAVQTLPPKRRTIFLLRFVEGMPIAEIAQVTRTKEGTVKSQLFSAVRTIREKTGQGI